MMDEHQLHDACMAFKAAFSDYAAEVAAKFKEAIIPCIRMNALRASTAHRRRYHKNPKRRAMKKA